MIGTIELAKKRFSRTVDLEVYARKKEGLSLKEVILKSSISDLQPLIKYLKMDFKFDNDQLRVKESQANKIANYLREMGSNDIATMFRGHGVEYSEVLLDVGKKLKATVRGTNTDEENESEVVKKIFEESLEKMSSEEKRELLESLGLKEGSYNIAGPAAMLSMQIFGQLGGFATYQISMIVANMVARALLGHGLSLATNAAITRGVSVFLGPVGWIASGVWLAIDIAGPAFRKTVPAILQVAMLRQFIKNKATIGLVGEGSSGKDSLAAAVFNLDTSIDPVAGSTSEAENYQLGENNNLNIINYAGFHDIRNDVNSMTDEFLGHTDIFIWVIDVNRGITKSDEDTLNKIKSYNRPILACLNKIDLPKTETDKNKLIENIRNKVDDAEVSDFIETAFDPDPRLLEKKVGCFDVYLWVALELAEQGKDKAILPAFKGEK